MKLFLFITLNSLFISSLWAAPEKDLDKFWLPHAPEKTKSISHSQWQTILNSYLVTTQEQQTFFSYSRVSKKDLKQLKGYINELVNLDPNTLTRAQQKAYWINLYNAKQ